MKTKMFVAAFAAMFAFSVMSCGNKKAADAPAEEAAVEFAAAGEACCQGDSTKACCQGDSTKACCKGDSAKCEKKCDKACEEK